MYATDMMIGTAGKSCRFIVQIVVTYVWARPI